MSQVRPFTLHLLTGLLVVWLGWAAIMLGFQALAPMRFSLERPDQALDWTAAETAADAHKDHPYLADPFLAGHAQWDSEYYVSIALKGYDDPAMLAVGPASRPDAIQAAPKKQRPGWVGVDHAFLPVYPFAIGLVARPFIALGARPVAAAVGAGVAISLAGTLAAMIALADLARSAPAGRRAAFYLLAWPGAVFLAQVYSEGLFLGLSFGAIALVRRKAWPAAAALAAAAVFTRATGGLLLIPFLCAFITDGGLQRLRRPAPADLLAALCAFAPALAYLAWRALYGADFSFVETHYFGRGLFQIGLSLESFSDAFAVISQGPAPSAAYYLLELTGLAAALATAILCLRRDPTLALYSLPVLGVAVTSGSLAGALRYALSLPALFLVPAQLGRNTAFDRLWTLAGALGLAVETIAFTFGFWAG